MSPRTAKYLLLPLLIFSLSVSGCGKPDTKAAAPKSARILQDKPIADYRKELLDIAFEAATSIPVDPHIKDRSRMQEEVVYAALKLGQPLTASDYIEKIGDWRKGSAYASLAFYCAKNDFKGAAHGYLDKAEELSKFADQDWRRDHIRVKIAKTHLLLGNTKEAEKFSKKVEDAETGKVESVKAATADDNSFEGLIEAFDKAIALDIYDVTKNMLESSTEIFNRFYDDPERRALVEQKIKSSWYKMPIFIRFGLLEKMADFALGHNDKEKGLQLIAEMRGLIDDYSWDVEHGVGLRSRLAKLLFMAGDTEKARAEADAALASFESGKDSIMEIYRTRAIRPLAEAYQSMGDAQDALKVYRIALEAGAINVNARPRAEDLTATCISMALSNFEPDEKMWKRIRQIKAALRTPW